ncbi:MAG: hypothetical protein J6O49_03630, partial [Bacteroidaceae bacterium]|nr:hypothetical protein [Bacteroidaceae bacterium]
TTKTTRFAHTHLDEANEYAKSHSTCAKVQVGSLIIPKGRIRHIYGCNHGVMDCVTNGCRRVRLYGENSKAHRLPSDCDALHSEIDAICNAAKEGIDLDGATIFVTRYPCEACARAVCQAGIKTVIYGRNESISDYTHLIFETYGVTVKKIDDWTEEDNNA